HARYDQAFVVGFDVTPEVTQDFTDNTELLAHGVHELRPGGGTALYDALYFACRDKLLKAPKSATVRRAIILLSDGEDNQSHVTREEAIEMAQRAEAIVYTISTNVSGSKGPGDKVLERIAEATGGRAFFPFQIRDVANAFAEIQDELRSQYAVSYKPADFKADGHFRTIEIVASDRKNFRVRARRGYYAPAREKNRLPASGFWLGLSAAGLLTGDGMAGYSGTPLPKKLGIKAGFRVGLAKAPAEV